MKENLKVRNLQQNFMTKTNKIKVQVESRWYRTHITIVCN